MGYWILPARRLRWQDLSLDRKVWLKRKAFQHWACCNRVKEHNTMTINTYSEKDEIMRERLGSPHTSIHRRFGVMLGMNWNRTCAVHLHYFKTAFFDLFLLIYTSFLLRARQSWCSSLFCSVNYKEYKDKVGAAISPLTSPLVMPYVIPVFCC